MAMHYFHMANGQTTFDSVGTNLPDLQSVRKEALRAGCEMLNLGGGRTVLGWRTVADMGHRRARWFRTNDPYHRTEGTVRTSHVGPRAEWTAKGSVWPVCRRTSPCT
jgi:hypothetical protein